MRLSKPRQLLRSAIGHVGRVAEFLRMDRDRRVRPRWSMLRRGFFSGRAGFYPFDRYDWRWFVSDWATENFFQHINPKEVNTQFGNKLFLHLLLRELGFDPLTAPLAGALVDGRFTSFSTCRGVADVIARHGAAIVKPIDGFGGRGVLRVTAGEPLPDRGMYIVEGMLRPHAYAAQIFPGSINTIRLLALRLNAEEPFIAAAVHRFGVARSAPVDNFSRGGVAAAIDLATGTLGEGRSSRGYHPDTRHATHPDTQVRFAGTVIPMWTDVCALVLELMRRVPGVQMVGWDICLTPDGPRIIEGNAAVPGPDLLQVHQPLLLDARTRRFFLAKGIVSRRRFEELERLAGTVEPRAVVPGAESLVAG